MQNAILHQPLTNAQPVPQQSAIIPSQLPSVLLFNMMPCGREYPSAQSGSAVLVVSWLCPLPVPHTFPDSSLAGQHKKLKSPLFQCKSCSVTTKILVCYQTFSHPKSKIQPCSNMLLKSYDVLIYQKPMWGQVLHYNLNLGLYPDEKAQI